MRVEKSSIAILASIMVGALALWPERVSALTLFVIETADGTANNNGLYSSLALDAQGNPHVAYLDQTIGDLKYARRSGGIWTRETADGSANAVGTDASLALDAAGNPHVSYFDFTTTDLKYAWKSGGVWTRETVDASANSVGRYASIALDTLGNPHVCYQDQTTFDLKYAWKSGGVWTRETADATNSVGWYASLALDTEGNPHVTYMDLTTFDLKYARKTGGSWTKEFADSSANFSGSFNSLALDDAGNPHVSYRHYINGLPGNWLKYAWKSGGAWSRETADSSESTVGQFSSLALDAQGNPHVTYQDFTNNDLKYAMKSGGAWTIEIADGDGTLNATGQYTSLALDALGNPHVSYYDQSLGDLMYATANAVTGIEPPSGASLSLRVFPNPISDEEALIRYEVDAGLPVELAIFDVSGRRLSTLVTERDSRAGTASWTGLDAARRRLAPGTYFLRLEAGGRIESTRVTVVR